MESVDEFQLVKRLVDRRVREIRTHGGMRGEELCSSSTLPSNKLISQTALANTDLPELPFVIRLTAIRSLAI
jgi:hypothetical protein